MENPLARSKSGYIPTLDGWRAIAIAGVILFHGGLLFPARAVVSRLQNMGASGVELFFAISGILICSRLVDEEEARGRISLRNFYLRRIFRIQPAALMYLAALLFLAGVGTIPFSPAGWWTALLSVRNLYRSTNPADGAVYTAHFWSLAVEEHFYLLMPWLLVLLRGKNRVRWFGYLAAAALVANELMTRSRIAKMTVNSEFELCWLFLAAWLALLIRRPGTRERFRRFLPAGPVLTAVCLIGVGVALRWRFVEHLWLPGLPLLVLSTMLNPKSIVGRCLEWAPLRAIGRISYSLYLWQELFCLAPGKFVNARGSLGWMQHHPQSYVFLIGCALASYFLVEKPFVQIGHRLTKLQARRPIATQVIA